MGGGRELPETSARKRRNPQPEKSKKKPRRQVPDFFESDVDSLIEVEVQPSQDESTETGKGKQTRKTRRG